MVGQRERVSVCEQQVLRDVKHIIFVLQFVRMFNVSAFSVSFVKKNLFFHFLNKFSLVSRSEKTNFKIHLKVYFGISVNACNDYSH